MSATLAGARGWQDFAGDRRALTNHRLHELAILLGGRMLLAGQAQPSGDQFEDCFAEASGHRRHSSGLWDVSSRDRRGWQLKVLQEVRCELAEVRPRTGLTRISAPPLVDLPATKAAVELFAILRARLTTAIALEGIRDSRVALLCSVFYRGRPCQAFWEEPYRLDQVDASRLEWEWQAKSWTGSLAGRRVWQWYPAQGQLRHYFAIPERPVMIDLPLESLGRVQRIETVRSALAEYWSG